MKTIQYAVEQVTGLVISRVESELAWPILDYDNMLPENNYQMKYQLEKISIPINRSSWDLLKWTKKIPTKIKNLHRVFWGMKPLAI